MDLLEDSTITSIDNNKEPDGLFYLHETEGGKDLKSAVDNGPNDNVKGEVETQENNQSVVIPLGEIKKELGIFKEMDLEAIRLQELFKDIRPNLKHLARRIVLFGRKMDQSEFKDDPRMKLFRCELELLKNHVAKSRSNLLSMQSDVKKLLSDVEKASGGSTNTDLHKDKSSAQIELSDVEDDFQKGSSGDDNSIHQIHNGLKNTLDSSQRTVNKDAVNEEGTDAEFKLDVSNFTEKKSLLSTKQKPKKLPIPESYQCDKCGRLYKSKRGLRDHKWVHAEQKPFLCEICGREHRRSRDAALCKHGESTQIKPRSSRFEERACQICGELIANRKLMKLHNIDVHNLVSDQVPMPCLICDEIFFRKSDLHDHLPVHISDDNTFLKCKFCDEYFTDPFKLREHLAEHNKRFACDICNKKFYSARSYEKHKKSHTEYVTCQVCGRTLASASRLQEHMNVHTGEKPYECDICHIQLSSNCALKNHKARVHIGNGSNTCLICGKLFKTCFARNSHHLKEHTEEERKLHDVVVPMFTCNICGETVRVEYKMTHLKKHKTKIEKRFICEFCGKNFVRLSELKFHKMKEHKVEDDITLLMPPPKNPQILKKSIYTCDICGKQYPYKSSLNIHKAYHSDAKPFACSVCGKAFKLKQQMKQHEATHSGKKPYQCGVCGKGFGVRALLNFHLRKHTGEKPFSCHLCSLSFSLRANLVRHVTAVHENKRRFECEVCHKRFNQKNSLIVHRRIHTGEKPHTCHICGVSFSDPSTLHKHKAMHAKKSANTESEPIDIQIVFT
ncbi:zinc finger protein 26 [Elysia marginata]|uniref:Zinc finger protein 26 n=1 Tax=Elysia marginata TaxID=1093978 RepID=A0AAV4HPN1_9GAST|nr:zinc finger protein 26 [Elysia marginata]